jgi:hypothetical protein
MNATPQLITWKKEGFCIERFSVNLWSAPGQKNSSKLTSSKLT